jgi:ABC-type transporter Mla subunit MlaD
MVSLTGIATSAELSTVKSVAVQLSEMIVGTSPDYKFDTVALENIPLITQGYIRDAMSIASTIVTPAAGSIDKQLENIATDISGIDTDLSSTITSLNTATSDLNTATASLGTLNTTLSSTTAAIETASDDLDQAVIDIQAQVSALDAASVGTSVRTALTPELNLINTNLDAKVSIAIDEAQNAAAMTQA